MQEILDVLKNLKDNCIDLKMQTLHDIKDTNNVVQELWKKYETKMSFTAFYTMLYKVNYNDSKRKNTTAKNACKRKLDSNEAHQEKDSSGQYSSSSHSGNKAAKTSSDSSYHYKENSCEEVVGQLEKTRLENDKIPNGNDSFDLLFK